MKTEIVLFGVVFVAGPLIYAGFLRWMGKIKDLRSMVIGAIVLLGGALVAGHFSKAGEATSDFLALASLGMVWAGWIMVLALCVAVLRRRQSDRLVRKWTVTIGAVATTLPWMGLLAANWMAG